MGQPMLPFLAGPASSASQAESSDSELEVWSFPITTCPDCFSVVTLMPLSCLHASRRIRVCPVWKSVLLHLPLSQSTSPLVLHLRCRVKTHTSHTFSVFLLDSTALFYVLRSSITPVSSSSFCLSSNSFNACFLGNGQSPACDTCSRSWLPGERCISLHIQHILYLLIIYFWYGVTTTTSWKWRHLP